MATIISCYFYLPGSLCSVKQFKVLLARFLQQAGMVVVGVGVWVVGGWIEGMVGRGVKRGKTNTKQ